MPQGPLPRLSAPKHRRSDPPWPFKPVDLSLSPSLVALGLRHLSGLFWLDSSQSSASSISWIAAEPEKVLTGQLPEDWELIQAVIAERGCPPTPDWTAPSGGVFGWVGYDGQFVLGVFSEVMVYFHHLEQWFETGNLAARINRGAAVESPIAAPQLAFSAQMAQSDFVDRVQQAKSYIAAGDIYQVNLSYPWHAPWPEQADPMAIYLRLREVSPAPFSAFLDLEDRQILSASPELFLRIQQRQIITRPIKGTRPRFELDPVKDLLARMELAHSEKERAELLMITDLERNDLGRVCEFGSILVPEIWQLEAFPQVFHLVSTVQGVLRPEITHPEAFSCCFPGGSITGAPKKRAMEIIRELEPHPRGIYTGAIGGFGFNQESFWSIAIRTAVRQNDRIHFHTGAGIVADSNPRLEYEETVHKAAGLLAMGKRSP